MSRQVQFIGLPSDLSRFADLLHRLPGITVEQADASLFVESKEIEAAADANAARHAGEKILAHARRLFRLLSGERLAIELGQDVRERALDGTWHVSRFATGESVGWSFSLGVVALSVTGPGQETEDTVVRDSRLLQANPDIAAALDYIEAEDNVYGLYKAFEVITNAHEGVNGIVAKAWMTRPEYSRFAAFHRDRHHQMDAPHVEPMAESEARGFVLRLIRFWLREREPAKNEKQ